MNPYQSPPVEVPAEPQPSTTKPFFLCPWYWAAAPLGPTFALWQGHTEQAAVGALAVAFMTVLDALRLLPDWKVLAAFIIGYLVADFGPILRFVAWSISQ